MRNVIEEFLLDRKNKKIKEKIKPNLSEEEKEGILQDLEKQFSFNIWILDSAKRASQLSMVSHPAKFSHPDAKTSSIICENQKANDGYLRSGNVDYDFDVLGNAAALDVYKFLSLKLADGKTILNHLEQNSVEAKSALTNLNVDYEELRQGFLSIKKSDNSKKTDRLVKQVYFPIKEDSYHLLSILTPSGLLEKVKKSVDEMRFSEEAKEAKECRSKNQFHENGYDDIFDLTIIGYGGTKPQNISVINSQNGGRSYLLPSFPPQIKKRDVKLPKSDFFKNSLWIKNFENDFKMLAKLIADKRNNKQIRDSRDRILFSLDQNEEDHCRSIVGKIIELVFKIREFGVGWSQVENYQGLPLSQKIWLDDFYLKERKEDKEWAKEISDDLTRWITRTYETLHQKDKDYEMLGNAEFEFIEQEVEEAILITGGF